MHTDLPVNTSVTIYHRTGSTWQRYYIPQALWLDNMTQGTYDKNGVTFKHVIKLYLPANSLSFSPVPGVDFVTKGSTPEIDNTTPATISASMKNIEYKRNILEFSPFEFGSLQHIEMVLV